MVRLNGESPGCSRGKNGDTNLRHRHCETTSSRVASRRLARAVTLLSRASRQLDSASLFAPDKYNADRLRFLAGGLRDLSIPLSKIASRLEKGSR